MILVLFVYPNAHPSPINMHFYVRCDIAYMYISIIIGRRAKSFFVSNWEEISTSEIYADKAADPTYPYNANYFNI